MYPPLYENILVVTVSVIIFCTLIAAARFAGTNDDKPQPDDETDDLDLDALEEETQRRLITSARQALASAREEFNRAAREYCVSRDALAAQPLAEPTVSAYNTAREALRRWGINEPPITGESIDVKV